MNTDTRQTGTAVVIPAYNEAATIRQVVERTLCFVKDIWVVDDGSVDGTAAALEGLPVNVLRNPRNLGKAASLWRGLSEAVRHGSRHVVTLDGDGQHRPEDIPNLLQAAYAAPDAIIIGARLIGRENAPKARLFANNFADFWVSWAAGQKVRDSQSGFRVYPAAVIASVHVPVDRSFVFESEVLIEAARQGYACHAVAIPSIYHLAARASHFRPVHDIALIVRMITWKLLRSGLNPVGLWRVIRS